MFISTVLIVLKKHYRFVPNGRILEQNLEFFRGWNFRRPILKYVLETCQWSLMDVRSFDLDESSSSHLQIPWRFVAQPYIKMVLNKPLSRPPYTCYSYITHRDNICSTIHIIHFDQPQISSFELLMLTLGYVFRVFFMYFFV